MTFSENSVEVGRVRLPNRTDRVSTATGFDGLGGLVFGAVFVAAGIALTLVGLKILPVEASRVQAPYWVLSIFGGVFALGGMISWGFVVRDRLHVEKRRDLSAQHPGSKAFADYPWNPMGTTNSPWAKVMKSLAGSLVFAVFLIPFNWWAWGSGDGSWFVRGLIGLFDLFFVFGLIEFVRRIMAALKYGKSGIEYETFPFFTGDRINLRWLVPSGLSHVNRVTAVLRCVEERMERTEGDSSGRKSLLHDQLWAATHTSDGMGTLWPGAKLSLAYDVPETAPGSFLAGEPKSIFWELDISVDTAGVDFEDRYLVPIYRSQDRPCPDSA